MAPDYKPQGYTSVSPYLVVSGAERSIEFLVRAFGAEEVRRFADGSGRIVHAELRLDDTIVMIADGTEGWPPVPCHVHLYLPDVDAAYRRALEAGGAAVQPPAKKDDDDRRGGVRDPGGTTWWIATRVA